MPAVEPIRQALEMAGTSLFFKDFDILAFPGFNVSVLYKNEVSVYEVEKQNFKFEVATLDCKINSIRQGSEFYMSDAIYTYSFRLDREPEADLTGWSKLHTIFLKKSEC